MTVEQLRHLLYTLPLAADTLSVYLDPDGQEFAEAWVITLVPPGNAAGDEPKLVIGDDVPRRKSKQPVLITLPMWGC